ncbi:methylenetetrahydrofolate reductase [Maridesulfovibrio bastinii]|uniref:methylenetetrahydrofolate reductase n=1 Tax=Maridesulfovibrio bastinii TaxID=47157 RepID=UPI0003F7E3A0|nr:methylenetetrahydrofolate reductase [Maridesulfovibrio bastinii]
MKVANKVAEGKQFFSFEFFPPKDKSTWPGFMDTAGKLADLGPLFASVTYGAGGTSHENSLEICSRINSFGIGVVAHLTCAGAQEDSIDHFVGSLLDKGVEDFLALGGDGRKDDPTASSRFSHASDLVDYISGKFPEAGIAVAGYPGAHPDSPSIEEDLIQHSRKVACGADFTITQLFFDYRCYFDYVERLNDLGMNAPVLPGILPIQSLGSLKHIMSLCGAAIPGDIYCGAEKAFENGGDAAVKEFGLDFARKQIKNLLDGGAPGVHIYTLNKAEMCEKLITGLKQDGFFA